jgi:hypothetical protein
MKSVSGITEANKYAIKQYAISNRMSGTSNANEIPNKYSISNSNSKMLTKSLTSIQNIETFEDH